MLTTSSFAPRIEFGAPGASTTLCLAMSTATQADVDHGDRIDSALSVFQKLEHARTFNQYLTLRGSVTTGTAGMPGLAVGDLTGEGRPELVCFPPTPTAPVFSYQNGRGSHRSMFRNPRTAT